MTTPLHYAITGQPVIPQFNRYTTKGYNVHKLQVLPYVGWFSVYCDDDGSMLACEQRILSGSTRHVNPGTPCWKAVASKAATFKNN